MRVKYHSLVAGCYGLPSEIERAISMNPTLPTRTALSRVLFVTLGFSAGCHDLAPALPAGTQSPSTYNTPDGAVQQAAGAIGFLQGAAGLALEATGLFTDEFITVPTSPSSGAYPFVDQRVSAPHCNTGASCGANAGTIEGDIYAALQATRGQAELARGALTKYAPSSLAPLRGEMYAIEGYADVLLADVYCSGVPLTTLDFEGDFTYKPGSPTFDTYRTAAALFDSAVALSSGDSRVSTLARVGKGRALIALGQFDSAAHVVSSVGDSWVYVIRESGGSLYSVADREGVNGFPYRSSNDPRTRVTEGFAFVGPTQVTFYVPSKYDAFLNGDSVSVVLASGVEARLIEAEADLRRGGSSWLTILNRLRTDSTTTVTGNDTVWNAGGGGVAGLAPLQDPGSDTARVTLLFRERAFWLFATAHRMGDLRRLIRGVPAGGYGRRQDQVYPVGLSASGRPYGTDVSFRVPDTELPNPNFKGCLNHE